MGKLSLVLGQLSADLQSVWNPVALHLPELLQQGPKLSNGEKYDNLPWLMLDFPRKLTGNEGFFALRTFFWWGNYFSIQLILSGRFQSILHQKTLENPLNLPLTHSGWHAGKTTDAWNSRIPQQGLFLVDTDNLKIPAPTANEEVFKLCTSFELSQLSDLVNICIVLSENLVERLKH